VKNFHLPLPEEIDSDLRSAADRLRIPATIIAREAISAWLRAQKKAVRRQAVMQYATSVGGTRLDLDRELESAAVEELVEMDRARK
jgi:hypothetical protein